MRIETDKIYCGDSLQVLQTLPDNCMDCCVTSPPYYALRDYGTDGQIGREATPEEYVSRITAVFHEVKRVLTPEGTCWLNIADTYCGTGSKADHQDPKYPKGRNGQQVAVNHRAPGCKPKDLIGIPWLVALALRGDGWYLRSSIIWHKGNPMPESTRDRPTRCYEYVFLLTKSKKYYYDWQAVAEPIALTTAVRLKSGVGKGNKYAATVPGQNQPQKINRPREKGAYADELISPVRSRRNVWQINTASYRGGHFAAFPPKLAETCILAGCPVGGIVLDPFLGSGTTAAAAKSLSRRYIGIEINPEYCTLANSGLEVKPMSKELKAPDKVTQKMTRDGAVAENLTTGETSSISERPQEENYSAPAGAAAEKVVQHIGAEIERHAAKGAEKKALDAAQLKTHTSRLQFSEAERATPELQKAIKKSDTAADRLDAARAAIPKQTKITKERVFDEAKGKAKTRLAFEKTDKPPNGKLRHNPLSRPAQELDAAVHGKIYEVEKENVGVESGHRVELAGEKAGGMAARAVKRGIRSHKLKPYRAAAAAEKKAVKANADFLYQKALHDNPALAHSNPISRFWQKQRIKKQYAKTLKAGGKVKKTAEATAKAAKKTAQETKRATFFVVRHWKGCLIVGGIAFIVLLFFGGLSSCSLFGGNSGSGLIASSYLSEDADITGAESAYAAMEAELQDMLDNIESEYPGYDEYRVNADEIEHDPYVLISILSAWHEGVFTLDEAQSTLEMLFEKQYILTVTEEVEVRYRTETRTDSEGNEYDVEVAYNYYILNVDLENFNLSHVPVYIMGEEQLSMYAMYMSSLGNRPDLFPQSGYISKYYENPPADYEIPPAYLEDEQFARLIEEAEKYVGFPLCVGRQHPGNLF